MTEKKDFFQKKLSNTRSFRKQHSASRTWIWILIAIVAAVLIGGFVWYRLFVASPNLSSTEDNQPSLFSLGQEIEINGELKSDGDIVTHTHTITDPIYGILAVKSKVLNLGEYKGIVEAIGIVEKFYQGNPIIEITTLSGQIVEDTFEETTDIVLDESSGVYLPAAGVHFLPAFFEYYLLLNEGENGQILIQDLETDQEIVLNYFRCNASDPNRNCKGLVDTFSQTAARSFVTANGDTYYKQAEVNSRFVVNGDRWGIFINDVPEEMVMKLKDLIVFANDSVMKNWLNFSAPRVCQNTTEKLQKITSSAITLKQEGLIATIEGKGYSHDVNCSVLVDFSLPAKGTLLSFEVGDTVSDEVASETTASETTESTTSSTEETPVVVDDTVKVGEVTWDSNVEQFSLNPEKGLTYNSSRGGYSLKFPSGNISYSVGSVKENFGQTSLYCSYVINVIKYSEKENLEISPAVRIYECTASGDIPSLGEKILIKQGAGKFFVIQINDPAWIDFANALSFVSE